MKKYTNYLSRTVFNQLLQQQLGEISQDILAQDAAATAHYQRLQSNLERAQLDASGYPIGVPEKVLRRIRRQERQYLRHGFTPCEAFSEEKFKRFREVILRHFAPLLDYIPKQEYFSTTEVCSIMSQIFQDEFCRGTEFRTVIGPEKAEVASDMKKRILTIPGRLGDQAFTYDEVFGRIFGHEFCGHIYRGLKYEGTEMAEFNLGLPGFEIFEEGLARCIERALIGKTVISAEDYYLNLCLAGFGLVFQQGLYEIRLALDYLRQLQLEDDLSTRAAKFAASERRTIEQVRAVFPGYDHTISYAGLIYYQGDQLAQQYLMQSFTCPDELAQEGTNEFRREAMATILLEHYLWEVGKIDCTNRRHLAQHENRVEAIKRRSPFYRSAMTIGF